MTNIDNVNGIDYLQVLQHTSRSGCFLRVIMSKGCGMWAIGPRWGASPISSSSAGGLCPAADNDCVKNWQYSDNGVQMEAVIKLSCSTHC